MGDFFTFVVVKIAGFFFFLGEEDGAELLVLVGQDLGVEELFLLGQAL